MKQKIVQATEAMLKQDLHDILIAVQNAINHGACVDGIYGVPRGGLPIAVLLSNRLGLPLLMAPTKQCIVCDDILDSGKMMDVLYEKYCRDSSSRIFVWYINEERKAECRERQIYYVRTKKAKDWVQFFWE